MSIYSTMKRGELMKAAAAMFPSVETFFPFTNAQLVNALESGVAPVKDNSQPELIVNRDPAAAAVDGGTLAAAIAAAVAQYLPKPEAQEATIDAEQVKAICKEMLDGIPARVLEITRNFATVTLTGLRHSELESLIKVCSIELTGGHIPVLLVGPAASGKTTAAHQVAEALSLPFYATSIGPQTSKSDLMGYMDATGNYHATQFRQAFEHGGVMLLDEIDAGNPGVLTVINAATSNGVCGFPDGMVTKHKDFVIMAAANTFGRGADRLYVGRQQLDAATLDRFIVLNWDYDEELEKNIAANKEWTAQIQTWRHKAADDKLRVVISPRASMYGAALLQAGFNQSKVEAMAVFKGLDIETERKIRG